MTFPLPVPAELEAAAPPGSSVLLGLSGGVDSSLALALLKHLGCDVHCVTLKNFCTSDAAFGGAGNRSCCSLDAIDGARRLAARFGSRHWVGGVEDRFKARVIDPFVREYLSGRTPNPCVGCNTAIRFPELARRADALGLDLIATGHYARLAREGGETRLLRGVDAAKDQSYFLHGLDQAVLGRCVFPLGWFDKGQVRAAAAALGLEAARRPDSQEICFIPDGDRAFLFEGTGGREPGDIVDRAGRVLGRHRGLAHYTVGQRRGLGIAAPEPLYVLSLEPESNRLIAGARHELDVFEITCDGFRSPSPSFPEGGAGAADASPVEAQVRHRQRGVPVATWSRRGGTLTVTLSAPARGVAPGQFLVLYAGDRVLGGARIVSTS
ncbi:tRNA 2-thiouridine(34) synthase MnmA [bacterium]|nr:tRNA 2-thiouridine(34) synthase MnmA [bacterium]